MNGSSATEARVFERLAARLVRERRVEIARERVRMAGFDPLRDLPPAEVATRFLLAHRPPPDPQVERVATIVAGIARDRDLTRVEQLVERHALGKRALQRLFSEYVGVSP